MSVPWELELGKTYRRIKIHETYGGRRQGGISPSRVSPNVMLFTDPTKNHKHGYFDGWGEDGYFHYAGEGQTGDQRMVQGNLSIYNHVAEGRALRLFRIVSVGQAFYCGEFVLAPEDPTYEKDAPETNGGPDRKVIMFRLVRTKDALPPSGAVVSHTPTSMLNVEDVDVEQHNTEHTSVDPSREPYESERREAALVQAYKGHLERAGHTVKRKRIYPPDEARPLFTDIHDLTTNTLVEAKGSVTREAIRMAIGQLLDYRRHLEREPDLAVLVPTRPRQDLINFCTGLKISVVYQHGNGFDVIEP
ncbi:restriction endonuclease [Catenulispora sp. EB89]|uniref:restriction endonuclease n=1 Tax=Catenulispora sp. EB89 TaxID=3156257 RepID=UPI003512EC43